MVREDSSGRAKLCRSFRAWQKLRAKGVYLRKSCFKIILTLRTWVIPRSGYFEAGAMPFKVMVRLYSLTLSYSPCIGRLGSSDTGWGRIGHVGSFGQGCPGRCDCPGVGSPFAPIPARAPAGQSGESFDRVSRPAPHCPAMQFSASCSVQAETGKDLLTYLEISRT